MDPFGETGPDEPDEFDPESLGPAVPDPADVEPDLETSLGDLDDVDDDLFRAFWGAAVFLNVAIAAVSLGALLVYFRGAWSSGGAALVVGAVAAVFAARFYVDYDRNDDGARSDGEANP